MVLRILDSDSFGANSHLEEDEMIFHHQLFAFALSINSD